jgi:hypothetical protein
VSRGVRALGAVTAYLLVTGLLVVRTFVLPPGGAVDAAEAVVVLAGDASTRLPVAVRLAREEDAVLAVSLDDGPDNAPARALCEDPGDLDVACFRADRSSTRAEAQALGRLVSRRGWSSLAVVTSSYHVVRAGLLVERCTEATVSVVDARAPMSVRRWATAVVLESAGLLTVVTTRSC